MGRVEVSVQVRVEPNEGGAIVSLIAGDREWLVQGEPWRSTPTASQPFVAVPPRGWDEMMPTIDECVVDGSVVPDHGEAWRRPWTGSADALSFRSPRGYTLSRTVTRTPRSVRLDYLVESVVDQPFLWAAHPLFAAGPGSHIDLAGYTGEVLEVTSRGTRAVKLSPELLAVDGLDDGQFRKIVLPSAARVHRASVVHADGSWLQLSWDGEVVPFLAVYLERRTFTASECLAIEPMTGWYDSLADAVSRGLVTRAWPGHPVRWHLEVTAGSTPRPEASGRSGR